MGLGNAYSLAGRIDMAIYAYRRVVDRLPDSKQAWTLLGLAYRAAGYNADADAAFRKAQQLK